MQTILSLQSCLTLKLIKMENLSVQESLEVIASTIRKTKENMKEQSFYYLLWGWLTLVAALSQYAVRVFTASHLDYIPWLVLVPLGIVVTLIHGKKSNRQRGYETYLGTFLQYFWMVLGLSFVVVVFLSVALHVNATIFTLFLAGLGTLVSGLAMKFNPMITGGIVFYVFSVVSVFVSGSVSLLLFALAIALGYLLPAYLLKKS